ncbi:MAG TPA: SDR family NAD(P)-dependent oxidoreductase [Candidatus Dormibacteraeota bacterium]|nr:SDR family NAD(P)-dependent oxidoreductase [Candidatus Dormibacteraeota bacterium]
MVGRVAIVTGASRGIGATTARVLHRAGASVVLAARDRAALDELAGELGERALPVVTDVSDPVSVEHMVEAAVGTFGRLDAAVNGAAGGGTRPTPLGELPVDAFDGAIAVSLRGVFLSMRFEIPAMLASGGGSIVNIASTAGLQGVGGIAGYVAAKHGVVGLTRSAAIDYASRGVRVNAIAPGPIATNQLRGLGPDMAERVRSSIPMHRTGTPEECGELALWLCSDASAFITGTAIPIDGGKLAGMPAYGS